MTTKTTVIPREAIQRSWHAVDAKDIPLGRLASEVAQLLIGKHKPTHSFHNDDGDFVVVTNAAQLALTGSSKPRQKKYYRHSNFMGNLKTEDFATLFQRAPEKVVQEAVKGMLPNNKLRASMLKRLKVYAGENHPHHQAK